MGRGRDGRVFALRDICPHRGIPLSEGGFDGAELQCPFHGWRFDTSGTCISIPSMSAEAEFDCGRIRVKSYPVREVQGNVWIFFGDNPDTAPDIPVLPDVPDGRGPNLYLSMVMPCQIDEGVFGLMDPGHNTFVHVSRWWRKAGLLEEKEKAFGPSPFGFAMLPHRPSGNLLPYKLLGGAPTTQIIFRLPSCRMEHTRFGRHWYVTLSTVTPLGSGEIALNHTAYWSWPALNPFTPLLKWALWSFTKQDREILRIQSKGLKYDPLLMLIDDADTQANGITGSRTNTPAPAPKGGRSKTRCNRVPCASAARSGRCGQVSQWEPYGERCHRARARSDQVRCRWACPGDRAAARHRRGADGCLDEPRLGAD